MIGDLLYVLYLGILCFSLIGASYGAHWAVGAIERHGDRAIEARRHVLNPSDPFVAEALRELDAIDAENGVSPHTLDHPVDATPSVELSEAPGRDKWAEVADQKRQLASILGVSTTSSGFTGYEMTTSDIEKMKIYFERRLGEAVQSHNPIPVAKRSSALVKRRWI